MSMYSDLTFAFFVKSIVNPTNSNRNGIAVIKNTVIESAASDRILRRNVILERSRFSFFSIKVIS